MEPDELLLRLAAPLDRIRLHLRIDEETGRDLRQQVALKFLQEGSNKIRSPEGWILIAFRNECLSYIEKRRRSGERNLAYLALRAASGHSRTPSRELLEEEVREAISRLRPRDRYLILARYYAGWHSGRLAEALGVKSASVKNLLGRALSRLRRVMN